MLAHRPQLEGCARLGARRRRTLCDLSRQARAGSVASLVHIVERLEAKKASLRILNIALDTCFQHGSFDAEPVGGNRSSLCAKSCANDRSKAFAALRLWASSKVVSRWQGRKAKDVNALAALGVAEPGHRSALGHLSCIRLSHLERTDFCLAASRDGLG